MPTPRWSFLSSAEYNPQTAVHNATRVALIHPGSFLPSSAFLCRSLPILDPPLPSVDLPLPCPDLPLSARLQAAQYDLLRQLQADAITAVNVAQVSCRATISSSLQRSISVGAGGPRILSAVHDKASENGSI